MRYMNERALFTSVDARNDDHFSGLDWALFASISLIWGSSFLLIAISLESIAPELITWVRIAAGAAALALLPGPRLQVRAEDQRRIVLLSLIWVVVPFTLFPLAQQHINSAVTGLLNGATPIWVAIVSTVLLGRAPKGAQRLGIILGFVGVVLISAPSMSEGSSQALGVGLVLAATVCYGFALNLAAPLQAQYGSTVLMARVLLLATIWTLPLGALGLADSRFEWGPAMALLALGAIGTGAAFAIMAALVGRVGSTRASFITYLIPVVALVLGVVVQGDSVAVLALFGVAFVVGGAVLASRKAG